MYFNIIKIKKTITVLILIVISFAQEKYFDAYARYNVARVFGKKIPSVVAKGEAGMKKSIAKIKKQKQIADSLLVVAKEIQKKVETAMFDKAVKEHFKDWKGFANYDWTDEYEDNTKKGLEILQKVDSLDLSSSALLRLPTEIAECPNFKTYKFAC